MTKKLLANLVLTALTTRVFAQWSKLSAPEPYYPAFYITSNNNTLYVAGNYGVYSSTDNGASWNNLTNGYAASSSTSNKEIVFAGSYIYVRSTTQAVFRSPDGGLSWEHDTIGLYTGPSYGQNEISSMFYDAATSRIYCSKGWPSYGLYYKTPGAASWTKVNSNNIGANSAIVWGMVKTTNGIYAATSSGVFESTDGGNTFTKQTSTGYPNPTSHPFLAANPLIAIDTDLYFAEKGVFKSTDNGATWTRIDQNFSMYMSSLNWTWVTGMYHDGTDLYASVNSSGDPDSVYVSGNSGSTWQLTAGTHPNTYFTSFVSHNNKIYATGFSNDSIWVLGGASNSIAAHEKNAVAIYPNPATDKITISGNMEGLHTISLLNNLGQIVFEKTNAGVAPVSISTSNYSEGLYFVRLEYSDYQTVNKVAIKH